MRITCVFLLLRLLLQIRDGRTSFGGSRWRSSLPDWSMSRCPSEFTLRFLRAAPITVQVKWFLSVRRGIRFQFHVGTKQSEMLDELMALFFFFFFDVFLKATLCHLASDFYTMDVLGGGELHAEPWIQNVQNETLHTYFDTNVQ